MGSQIGKLAEFRMVLFARRRKPIGPQGAIDTLVALMRRQDEVPAVAERAAEALLDRGWGRPDVSANTKIERDVRALSTDELLADIASLKEALGGLPGAAGATPGADEPDSVH
jgi:hypothetical protein